MRTIRLAALLTCGVVLAACAPSADNTLPTIAPSAPTITIAPVADPEPPTFEPIADPEPPVQSDAPMGEAGGLFSVTVTGVVEENFAGSGAYSCDEGLNLLSTNTGGTGDSLLFELPPDITAGEYTLGDGGNDGGITVFFLLNGLEYNSDTFGVVTLDAVPNAPGTPVSGSYDINVTSEGSVVLNATGTFDLLAEDVCE